MAQTYMRVTIKRPLTQGCFLPYNEGQQVSQVVTGAWHAHEAAAMAPAARSQVQADNNAQFSQLMPSNEVLGAPEHMNLIGFKLAQPLSCLEPTTRASTSRSSGSYIHVLARADQPSQLGACFVETEGVTRTGQRRKQTQGAHRELTGSSKDKAR